MAVEKRKYKNRTTYRAYWRNPFTGKIEKGPARESLKEARKDDAEIKVKLEYEPDYFLPEGAPPPGDSPTLYHLSQLYLARRDLAESTRKEDFYHFAKIAPALGSIPAGEITREHLKDFEAEQIKSGVKQSTVQRRISIVRAILNWAVENAGLAENPVQGYRCKGGACIKLPPPSPAEVKTILAVSPPHLVRAILLSYYLGVRVGPCELLSLKWEDYDVDRKRMRIWSAKKNKERPWRDVDISPALLPLFLEWAVEDSALGLTHLITYKGKPVSSIKKAWWGALKKAGITRRIRLYDLRHAFATEALAAGADIKAVADIMGHASTAMIHKHYQHVVDAQKKKVVESIPDVLSGVQERGTKQTLSGYFSYPDKMIFQ
ncbi:site-specific integrase [Desulfovibrio sp. OttesenSCG-928-A18]|nr:site-specific integrase [Desulfovibrio sp. OttesenSCG-928-A18]